MLNASGHEAVAHDFLKFVIIIIIIIIIIMFTKG
jgi:hypothetical protein